MVNIADFYGKIGRYDEAIQLFEQSLNILEKKLGPEHPYCVQITDRLISIYGKM
jgi:tetratricopeptide (TPR) repeat protein